MVLNASDDDGVAFEFSTSSAEVLVKTPSQFDIGEERSPVFRCEDDVDVDCREGLRHFGSLAGTLSGYGIQASLPRVRLALLGDPGLRFETPSA